MEDVEEDASLGDGDVDMSPYPNSLAELEPHAFVDTMNKTATTAHLGDQCGMTANVDSCYAPLGLHTASRRPAEPNPKVTLWNAVGINDDSHQVTSEAPISDVTGRQLVATTLEDSLDIAPAHYIVHNNTYDPQVYSVSFPDPSTRLALTLRCVAAHSYRNEHTPWARPYVPPISPIKASIL
jgi:hypothetical protein